MRGILRGLGAVILMSLAACVETTGTSTSSGATAGNVSAAAPVEAAPRVSFDGPASTAGFATVVRRVEPVAERECRARTRGLDCDFRIEVDPRDGLQPNAYQTLDNTGRPLIVFTKPLIARAQNGDELAFVLAHEAAHHIKGHIAKAQENAMAGALLGAAVGALIGGDASVIQAAMDSGAVVGARTFSKDFELEADALGTVIAHKSGFDPVRGAVFFTRIPDPGDRFLGTHPPHRDRILTVQRVAGAL